MEPMHPQLRPLGIVWAVWSAFTALIGIGIGLVAAGFGGLISVLPDTNTGERRRSGRRARAEGAPRRPRRDRPYPALISVQI